MFGRSAVGWKMSFLVVFSCNLLMRRDVELKELFGSNTWRFCFGADQSWSFLHSQNGLVLLCKGPDSRHPFQHRLVSLGKLFAHLLVQPWMHPNLNAKQSLCRLVRSSWDPVALSNEAARWEPSNAFRALTVISLFHISWPNHFHLLAISGTLSTWSFWGIQATIYGYID